VPADPRLDDGRFDSVGRTPIFVTMLHRLRPTLPGGAPHDTPRDEPSIWRGIWRPLLALGLPPIVILASILAARFLLS
jgi:hypothetical protein